MEYDVVVVGSGAAGLTAAVVAAHEGLKVLLIEKTAEIGGTTALSGGGAWVPNNHLMATVGLSDSVDAARRYLQVMLGDLYEAERVEAYLHTAPEMLRHLEVISHLRFVGVPFPDYSPTREGAAVGRSVLPLSFDGSTLGPYLKKVRPPLRGFVLFKTMQVEPWDAEKLKNAFRSWEGFSFSGKRMFAFLWERLRFGRGAFLANGNAIVGRLLRSALDKGVEIWTEAPAIRLIGGRSGVTGARVERAGRETDVRARKAVILATGGFGANPQMRAAHIPMAEHHMSLQPDGNTGDGINLGLSVGGVWGDENASNGTWAPTSVLRDSQGEVAAKYPHFGPDRGKPGSIIVGADGKRFTNEAESYQEFVNRMHAEGVSTAWLIGDSDFLEKWGMGLAMPRPMSPASLIRAGYLIKAPTIRALAAKIGIDEAALENTVSRFNAAAARGEDPEFDRGGNIYDNVQGDPATKPNPNLGPLLRAPFYAVALHPGDAGTALGLKTTIDAQVLCSDGSIVSGLYAVGLDQNSVFRGVYPGGGSGIGPALTFAYRAGLSVAKR